MPIFIIHGTVDRTVHPLKPNLTQRFISISCPFEAHPQRLQPLFKSTENLIIAQKLNLDLRLGWISFGCYSKI
jgi:hypothetical protein